ncbi:MAG: hypothetical protein R3A78_07560 [Polyangiales bacterium]
MMSKFSLWFLPVFAMVGAGCSVHVYSPPARVPSLESAATVGEGKTGVALGGGYHGELFGGEIVAGTGRVRHGLDDKTDIVGEASLLGSVNSNDTGTEQPGRYGALGYVGLKRAVTDYLSLQAGLGGGGYAFGGFVAASGGAVLAWENPYVVPFLSTEIGTSLPVGGTEQVVSFEDDGKLHSQLHRPSVTGYGSATLGLRIPIVFGDGPIKSMNLLGGMSLLYLMSDDSRIANVGQGTRSPVDSDFQDSGYVGLQGALEVVF